MTGRFSVRRGAQYAAVRGLIDAVIARAYLATELDQPLNALARPAETLAALHEAVTSAPPVRAARRLRRTVAREVEAHCASCDTPVRWRRVALASSVTKVPRYCSACRSHVTGRKVVNWQQVLA